MSTYDKTLEILARHEGSIRTAGMQEDEDRRPPPPKNGASPGTPQKRSIPKEHNFDPKALKPIVQALWSLSVSLGHALTAHRQFSRLKSVSFSPDGLIGGRGYVMGVKDVRGNLHAATEAISAICDTLFDEVNAPHWKPKLAELEKSDGDINKLLEDAKGYLDDPEGEADEDMEEVESRPASWSRFKPEEEEAGSKIPNGGDIGNEAQGPHPARVDRPQMKQSSQKYSYDRTGESSVNPDTLPGPRVDNLDRGMQTGPYGSYNRGEPLTEDAWGRDQGVGDDYAYPSEWQSDLSDRTAEQPQWAASAVPNDPNTRTEGYDFGLGFGEGNDAHGQGAGGYANPDPSGKGVMGPRADLPDTPAGRNPASGLELAEQSTKNMGLPVSATAVLPNDGERPVARSDYYPDAKGNDVSRYSETQLPGDGAGGTYDSGKDLPNGATKTEQISEPYVKWDDDTHNMRPDYTYQRGPVEGPYAKS